MTNYNKVQKKVNQRSYVTTDLRANEATEEINEKSDYIIKLLERLVEIEEQNFRMRWGKEFVSTVQSTKAATYATIQQHMPRANPNKHVLPKKERDGESITK